MKIQIKLICFLMITPVVLFSQKEIENKKYGKLSGQLRTYYMNTFNKNNLKDFKALAIGGKIKYQYFFSDKIEIGGAIYNSNNTGIQDLQIPDESTGKISRYEEGLFDRLNLDNKFIFILGELYGKFMINKHSFSLGRMKFKSPFLNPQDGRMIPTLAQGVWYDYKINPENTIKIGLLNGIAPRSTGEFFSIGESIGTYAVGRDWKGTPAKYAGNTQSDYLLTANANLQIQKNIKVELWDYFIENVSNSIYIKPEVRISKKLQLQMEWLHQNKVGSGGNSIDSLRYFTANTSDVLGIQVKYHWKEKTSISLGYDRILSHGQFIFPREWGREFLFSFQKRERSEGSADNHALVIYYDNTHKFHNAKAQLQTIVSIGKQWKPSVLDPKLNKYAVPNYTHINFDIFFSSEKLKNLKPELLLVAKFANGDFPDNPNFYLNKTDLFHVDFILNYNF